MLVKLMICLFFFLVVGFFFKFYYFVFIFILPGSPIELERSQQLIYRKFRFCFFSITLLDQCPFIKCTFFAPHAHINSH